MSPSRFSYVLACFNEAQHKTIKDTGFGGFLTFHLKRVPRHISVWLVDRFNKCAQKNCIFKSNEIDIMPTDEHLELATPYGDREIDV